MAINAAAFDELLGLLNACYQLSDDKLQAIKQSYDDMYHNFAQFKVDIAAKIAQPLGNLPFLQHDGFDGDDEGYLLFLLLAYSMDCYIDDWKFYCDELCDYISNYAGQRFYIDKNEVLGDIQVVIDRLEQQTDFSLLSLSGNDDSYYIWLIKKAHKRRIGQLFEQLKIELNDPIEDW